MKDFYYILGTDANSTPEDIREAYKKLSKKFHPDLNGEDDYFASRFREVNEAYETLISPARRKKYDAALQKANSQNLGRGPVKPTRNKAGTWINIAFTLTLIALTGIFGYYVLKSITGSKSVKPNKTVVVVAPPVKHHKKKHASKKLMQAQPIKISPVKTIAEAPVKAPALHADTASRKIAQTAPIVENKPKHLPVADAPIRPGAGVTQVPNAQYTALVRANATGIVYMRQAGNYGSDVVTVIPGNSKVTVLEKGNVFCKISFNNATGYVPGWTLRAQQ